MFPSSTDFFGRITIYSMDIKGNVENINTPAEIKTDTNTNH
jgi:hypothetical protein